MTFAAMNVHISTRSGVEIQALDPIFGISLLRNLMGMGTLLAFPGSIIGAFLAGMLYKNTNKISLAFIGEVIGTGLIGALISYPIATIFMNKQVVVFTYASKKPSPTSTPTAATTPTAS